MLRNYLTVAYRSFLKQKGHTLLNLLGLSLGLASALCIFMYVGHELSYDKSYKNYEEIYGLGITFKSKDGQTNHYSVVPGGWVPRIRQDMPDVAAITKVDWLGYPTSVHHKSTDKIILTEEIRWVDPDYIKVFPLTMISGNAERALSVPNNFLLSESGAKTLFGNSDPVNQQLTIKHPFMGDGRAFEVVVAGVYKDFPTNCHMRPVYIGNSEAMRANFSGDFDRYYTSMNTQGGFFMTYLRMNPGAGTANLNKELANLADVSLKSDSSLSAEGGNLSHFYRQIADVHFDQLAEWEFGTKGSKKNLAIFSSVAMLILLIACINYMNLATARSAKRSKEVGMRKALGSNRMDLALQFLQESAFMAIAAWLISLIIVILILPLFNTIAGKTLSIADLFAPKMILVMVGTVLFVTLVGGSYPAFFLSNFKPVEVLKGRFTRGKGAERFRTSLVALQFSVSMILVIATGIIIRQMNFMQQSKLNEKGSQILSVRYGGSAPLNKYQTLKNAILQDPEIKHVTMANHLPRLDWFGPTNAVYRFPDASDQEYQWHQLNVDFDFPKAYDLELLAGRTFDPNSPADSSSYLVNESALKALNKTADEVLGLSGFEGQANRSGKIIGVVRDFPFQSAQHAIEPLVINPRLHEIDNIMYVELPVGTMQEKIASLEQTWKRVLPGIGFDYWFLNDEFGRMYQSERRISSLSKSFSVLAIIITVLGLYGMASYSAEQKTKEVGIRKVLGATVGQIVTLFLTSFTKMFLFALIIGVPVAWYLGNQWLQTFIYREPLNIVLIVLSVLGLMLVMLLTVSYETFKAAISDPVKAIRHE